MRNLGDSFNATAFSRFLNSPAGRVFRLAAGAVFLVAGVVYRETLPGRLSIAWSVFPLTAGGFDLCYISALLGGPITGVEIRRRQAGAGRMSML